LTVNFIGSIQEGTIFKIEFINLIGGGVLEEYEVAFKDGNISKTFDLSSVSFPLSTLGSIRIGSEDVRRLMTENAQFEKGNKATDWSPAPEDIFADLETKPNFDDIYIRSDLDDMFSNTVSLTAYQTDQQGYVE